MCTGSECPGTEVPWERHWTNDRGNGRYKNPSSCVAPSGQPCHVAGPAPSSPVGLIQVTFYPTSLLAVCLSMVPLPHSLLVFPGESSETITFIWPEMPCPYLWKSGPQPAEAFKGLWTNSPVLLSSVICLCQGHFLWGVNGRWQEAQRHGHSQRSLLETLSLKVYSEMFYSNIFPCRSEGIWRVLWRAGSIMGHSTARNVLGRSGARPQWEKSSDLRETCSIYLTSLLTSQFPQLCLLGWGKRE